MAFLGNSFIQSFKNVEADEGFSLIPVGTYRFEVAQALICDTKDGVGKYIKTQMKILGPSCQGRCIFKNFNIQNVSSDAERIGKSQLKALTIACGIKELTDTDQLLRKAFSGDVCIRKGRNGYADQNDVRNFKPITTTNTTTADSIPNQKEQFNNAGMKKFADVFAPSSTSQQASPQQLNIQQPHKKSADSWNFDPQAF